MSYFDKIIKHIRETFGIDSPQIPDILMLIALNEKGEFISHKLSKDEKMELINYGMLILLQQNGYAKKVENEIIPTVPLPNMTPAQQTLLIKQMIIKYFKDNNIV